MIFIPAIRLSSYNPLSLINEEYVTRTGNRGRNFLKDSLVVIQYFIWKRFFVKQPAS
jgi:hypothetical protein